MKKIHKYKSYIITEYIQRYYKYFRVSINGKTKDYDTLNDAKKFINEETKHKSHNAIYVGSKLAKILQDKYNDKLQILLDELNRTKSFRYGKLYK